MKLLIVSIAAAMLLNCNKSRITPEADVKSAITKRPATIFTDHGENSNLLYDQYGQLLVHTTSDAVHYYKPGNDHFLTQLLKKTNEKIIYKHSESDAENRIIKLDKFQQHTSECKMEFTYNNSGYLSKRKVSTEGLIQEFIYTYDAGNLVEIQEYENDVLQSTLVFTYYSDRLNTAAIDLFDFKQIGFVTDGKFGNQSKSLVKSLKSVSADGQEKISFQYFYKTDVNDYVRSMQIETGNKILNKYNFIFQ